MLRSALLLVTALAGTGVLAAAEEEPIVFRSDVSLVRVDAQVVDRSNRAVTGLQKEDFVLYAGGEKREIRNFESEDMPADVLLLLDVSGSMQPHIERLSMAAHTALQVMGPDDRVGVMVFDRSTRLRLPFKNSVEAVERELGNVLRQETFDGGTDITRGLLDAAAYMGREARREARHAIVILTDDQTERNRDENGVLRALSKSDTVLSALIAPDAMQGRYGTTRGGSWPSGGGGWPMGGPLGGIIFGRRGPYGGYPGGGGSGPVIVRPRMTSAGTEQIARQSGGDSLRVDDAAALETTLTRIRQRYTLHFSLPEGAGSAQERSIEVRLAGTAARRYPGSEVRYRRAFLSGDGSSSGEPVIISRTPTTTSPSTPPPADQDREPQVRRRRPAVNEDGSRIDPSPQPSNGGWRRAEEAAPTVKPEALPATPAVDAEAVDAEEQPKQGGWRRVKPGEQP